MKIVVDDLSGPEIAGFLKEHLDDMKKVSPPESKHALDLDGLRRPEITFWTVWDGSMLVGCGALMDLGGGHAEIKSMRTSPSRKRQGIASMLLRHMIDEARERGIHRLSLETGSMRYFEPARRLYAGHGFEYCPPFGDYKEDPNSVFMSKEL